jgi:cytochrome c oxidase cbb3-type subunit 3
MFWRPREVSKRIVTCALPVFLIGIQAQAQTSKAVAGQSIFSSTCAACHGLDGRGGEHAPNIATDPRLQRMTDAGILKIIRIGIPAAGMPGFASSFNDSQINAVLKYLRILQGSGSTPPAVGNASHGRSLFFGSARCVECHMVNGHGGFLGADLTDYGKGHSAANIREAILEPDKNLDPRCGTVTVLTRSGKKYTGVVRNEDNFSLQMQTTDGSFYLFDKAKLSQLQHEPHSLMPADYNLKLSKDDLDDLISFLLKPGNPGKTESVAGQ